ncbi:MAG: AI-2E family transporter [bacterium]|nr:AI-2E family transporter [bacterium]
MGFDKEKIKQIRNLMLLAAALVLCILYSGQIIDKAVLALSILSTFAAGIAIAFVFNIPMSFYERKVFSRAKSRRLKRMARPLSFFSALLTIAAVIAIVTVAVIPQFVRTLTELAYQIPQYLNKTINSLQWQFYKYPWITDNLQKIDFQRIDWSSLAERLMTFFSSGFGNVVTSTFDIAGKVVGGFINAIVAFIFGIYVLFQKEQLIRQSKLILNAYIPIRGYLWIRKTAMLLHKNFKSFITGQCLEACIIFILYLVVLSVLRIPYPMVISVFIAFMSLIPIVGAVIGAIISSLLVLIVSPVKAVIFLIAYVVVQQLEGNLIYPKVVGGTVGLPAIWVLAAVTAGSSLMGVLGMLTFIPLFATIYTLLRDDVYARNRKKKYNIR